MIVWTLGYDFIDEKFSENLERGAPRNRLANYCNKENPNL